MSITRVPDGQMAEALRHLLTSPEGAPPAPRFVSGFVSNLRKAGIRCVGWSNRPAGRERGLVAALVLPGRTALLMLPQGNVCRPIRADYEATLAEFRAVLHAALTELNRLDLHYLQA